MKFRRSLFCYIRSMAQKTLLLLDSYALAFRMFYAYSQNPLKNSMDEDVSMMHGYWGAVLRILAKHKPTHFAIARDVAHCQTFRHELYPDYKANRGPMPEEMSVQMPLLGESLVASGIPLLSEPGYEALFLNLLLTLFSSHSLPHALLQTSTRQPEQPLLYKTQ